MATAIVSAARGVPVRSDVAMTGEITLSGLVLPVGGIREKALAARRHGIRTFILPAAERGRSGGAAGGRPEGHDASCPCARSRKCCGSRCRRRRARTSDPRRGCGRVFYISGHGFGHASRQIEVINAVGARQPGDAHRRPHVRAALALRPHAARAGQLAAGRMRHRRRPGRQPAARRGRDHHAAPRRFYATLDGARQARGGLLREHGVVLVVVRRAAARLRRRAAAPASRRSSLANFTWDWIYADYARSIAGRAGSSPRMRDAYARAAGAWRMPLHGGFETVPAVADIPFVARHARHSRSAVRRLCGLAGEQAARAAILRRLRRQRPRPRPGRTASIAGASSSRTAVAREPRCPRA